LNIETGFFPPPVTLFAFVSQSLSKRGTCQEAVARICAERQAQGESECSLNTSNYVRARQRLPVNILQKLTCNIAFDLHQTCQSAGLWGWHGRQVKMTDGTTLLAADTPANRSVYPVHGRQKEEVGFPLLRACALISLSTGSVCDFAMAAYRGKKTGELTLARTLMRSLLPEDILLGDALMDSYFFIAQVKASGADALFEARRHVDFRQGRKNGPGDMELELERPARPEWMSKEDYDTYPETLSVRFVKDRKRILITTLLNPKCYSREELRLLYAKRWNVELDLRSIKDIMDMEMLRSQSPEMLEKEVWAKLLAYNLIRLTMAEAALKHGYDPRQLSFTGAIQSINAFVPYMQNMQGEKWKNMYEALLKAIASIRVGNRPGRREPRVVKRRPKPFPRMQICRQTWKKKRGF